MAAVRASGLNLSAKAGTDQAVEAEKFESSLHDAIIAENQSRLSTNRQPMSRDEAGQLVAGMVRDQALAGTGLWGTFQTHGPTFKVVDFIPDDERRQIAARLQAAGMAATPTNVVDYYNRKHASGSQSSAPAAPLGEPPKAPAQAAQTAAPTPALTPSAPPQPLPAVSAPATSAPDDSPAAAFARSQARMAAIAKAQEDADAAAAANAPVTIKASVGATSISVTPAQLKMLRNDLQSSGVRTPSNDQLIKAYWDRKKNGALD
jgi:hypothetical protein